MAARFSLGSLRALSVPTAVIEAAVTGRWWRASIAISPNGTLAYVSAVRPGRRLVRLDRRGALSAVLDDARDTESLRLSPDGQRVAMTIADPGGDGHLDLRVRFSHACQIDQRRHERTRCVDE